MGEARILLAIALSEPNFFGQEFLDLSMLGCIGSGWRGQMRKKYLRERYPDTSLSDAESNQVCTRVVGQQECRSKRQISKLFIFSGPSSRWNKARTGESMDRLPESRHIFSETAFSKQHELFDIDSCRTANYHHSDELSYDLIKTVTPIPFPIQNKVLCLG